MALDYSAISTSLEDIKNRALNLNTGLGQFQNQSIPGSDQTIPDLGRKLTGVFSQFNPAEEEKTIMEKFAGRRTLAEEGAEAQKKLITSQAETGIEEAKTLGEKEVTAERESRRGFATNTALVRDIEDRGAKRVRDIEKARDELLLKGDMAKAERLDNLLVQEQTLVTMSRQNWIRNLFGFVGAITGLAGFETPAAKGQRELQTEIQKSIINLAAKAPDVGITQSDDLQTALQKYRLSKTYTTDIRKGELELNKLEADIAKTNADAAKARADAQGLQIDTSNPQVAAVQRAVQFLTPGATADQRKDIIRTYQSMIKAGDMDQAKDYIQRVARQLAPITERDKVTGREEAIIAVKTIKNALDAYEKKGGKTGLLTGNMESIAWKIGRTTDPEIAQLANNIRLAIIDYRKAVSGAAFTPSEAAEYQALFPSVGNVPELNNAKIQSLLDTFGRNQELFYSRMFGSLNYNTLFGGMGVTPAPIVDRSLGSVGADLSDNLFGDVLTNIFNQP